MFILSLTLCASQLAQPCAFAQGGELYSETTYVPQYGLLSDSQLRFVFWNQEPGALYVAAALQRQDKTSTDQDDLYSENLAMVVLGTRIRVWESLTAFIELRTEERSRGGFYAGNMWQYPVADKNMFSEFYGEAIILPSFHNDPVSTFWFKQGLRFNPSGIFLDPYLEVYLRRSPTPDLGRDTDQARVGLRTLHSQGAWTAGLLIYQSYAAGDEPNHEEALLFIAGGF